MNENKVWLSEEEHLARLPRKRVAAGALMRNAHGAIMIVKPTYRTYWLIPGGTVDAGEAPLRACVREVREELDLDLPITRLLCVAHHRRDVHGDEVLHFIFDGGVVIEPQLAQIRLPADEIAEYRFVSLNEALTVLSSTVADCVRVAYDAIQQNATLYAEDGVVV